MQVDCPSPLLSGSVREDSEDLFVQQRHLLEPRQLLSEFHLQTVASTVFPFQMLDGADAPDREKQDRALSDPDICSSRVLKRPHSCEELTSAVRKP